MKHSNAHGGAAPHREAYRNAIQVLEQVYGQNGEPVRMNPTTHTYPAGSYKKYTVNRPPDGNDPTESGGRSKQIRMTQSYLRSDCQLSQNLSTYNFGILDREASTGNNSILPQEQRLKQQDVFFVYDLGFYVYCSATAAANTTFKYELMTFPNPNFYSGFGAGAINLDQLCALWQAAVLQVQVNNNVLTPNWDIAQHFYVPETQINTTIWPSGNYFNEIDLGRDGRQVVEPNWIINGGNNNQYIINYPVSLTTLNFGSFTLYISLIWRGFLAQNCSSLMDNK